MARASCVSDGLLTNGHQWEETQDRRAWEVHWKIFTSLFLDTCRWFPEILGKVLVGVPESERNVHLGRHCVAYLDSLSGFLWHQRTPSWSNIVAERAGFSRSPSPLLVVWLILKHPSIFSFSLCICVKFHMTALHPLTCEMQKHLPLERKHYNPFSSADNKEDSGKAANVQSLKA